MTRPLCAALLLLAAACGSAATHPADDASSSQPTTAVGGGSTGGSTGGAAVAVDDPNAPRFRVVGRSAVRSDGSISFGWPNTVIEANFTGTSLRVQLSDTYLTHYQGIEVHNRYAVTVDGQAAAPLLMQTGVGDYLVAQNLAAGSHSARLVKETENVVGNARLKGFTTDGKLLAAPAPAAHRIEYVGASIEAGYGDLAEVTPATNCHFSDTTESASHAWTHLTAEALQADAFDIAFSGKGVYRNNDPSTQFTDTLPQLYGLVDPSYVADGAWDFTTWQPQVVLIDLSANDFVLGTPPQAPFVAAYVALLQRVRKNYPAAKVVATIGPTHHGAERSTIRAYVQAAVAGAGDANTSFLEFNEYLGNTYGCDGHPDSALQQAMATQATAALRALLGW